jgi:predicted HAD superfamily Cof-like phosphohydrolase
VLKETFVADVKKFAEIAGHTTDQFNVRQTALYIGLQLEEMAEKLSEIFWEGDGLVTDIVCLADAFKSGSHDVRLLIANHENLLDADIDLAWVTIGSMLSQGANIHGAIAEVTRANLDKFPDGVATKDANGKIKKPEGWRGPDLSPFVNGSGK